MRDIREMREMVRDSDAVDLIRHELSTPVATALLYIGIAENYAARTPGDPIAPALRIVRSEVQRLKVLLENMTELQRSGRPFVRTRFMDIGATVRATVKRVLTTFAGTESVTIVGPSQTVQGWWDPIAVEQIVTNLLSNALKFGQGRLGAADRAPGAGGRDHLGPRSGRGDRRGGSAAHLQALRARAGARRAAAWAWACGWSASW